MAIKIIDKTQLNPGSLQKVRHEHVHFVHLSIYKPPCTLHQGTCTCIVHDGKSSGGGRQAKIPHITVVVPLALKRPGLKTACICSIEDVHVHDVPSPLSFVS